MKKNQKPLKYSDFKLVAFLIIRDQKEFAISPSKLLKHIAESGILKETDFSTKKGISKRLNEVKTKIIDKIADKNLTRFIISDFDILLSKIEDLRADSSVDRLIKIGEKSIDILNGYFGVKIEQSPSVFIVAEFPRPYHKVAAWDFMYADEEDNVKHDIDIGLYIHTKRQFPFYSEILIIHEYVHFFFNKLKDPGQEILYKWLEESLADWFSLRVHYELFGDISTIKFAKNMNLLYSQTFPFSTLTEYQLYNDVIQSIYKVGGQGAIVDLAKGYVTGPTSKYWGELFDDIINFDFQLVFDYKREHQIDNSFDLLMSTNKQTFSLFDFSSVEYIILSILNTEMKYEEIKKAADLDEKTLKQGLLKLQSRGFIFENNRDNFEIAKNIEHILQSEQLKIFF